MTILRLIDKLQKLKDQYGNIAVESRNPAGDFDPVEVVDIVNVSQNSKITNWRVYLDT